jgi:hypothetical protein
MERAMPDRRQFEQTESPKDRPVPFARETGETAKPLSLVAARVASHCPKCQKPMRLVLVKTGGRKLKCIDCDGDDPLRSPVVAKLLTGELGAEA